MNPRPLSLLLAALLVLSSCALREAEQPSSGPVLTAAVPIAAASAEPEGRAVDDALKSALISFTDELFRRTIKKKNTVLSPLSAYIALAMTANGARGDTLAGMETALGLDAASLNGYLYSLTNALAAAEGTKVTIANSIWGNADNTSRGRFNTPFGIKLDLHFVTSLAILYNIINGLISQFKAHI